VIGEPFNGFEFNFGTADGAVISFDPTKFTGWSRSREVREDCEGTTGTDFFSFTTTGGTFAMSSTFARSGVQSTRINRTSANAVKADLNGPNLGRDVSGVRQGCFDFYFRVATLPSAEIDIACFFLQTGNNLEITLDNSGNLRIRRQNTPGTSAVIGTGVTTGQWYLCQFRYDTSTGTAFGYGSMNNGAESSVSWAQTAEDVWTARIGTSGTGTATYDIYYDDLYTAAGAGARPTKLWSEVSSSAVAYSTGDTAWNVYQAVAGGGVTNPLSVAGTITPAGALTKTTMKPLAGSVTPAAAGQPVRQTQLAVGRTAGTTTPTGAVVKRWTPASPFAGTVTPAGAETRQTQKPLSGTTTPSGVESRQTQKPLGGTITPTGVITRLIGKLLSGTITPTGADTVTRVVLLAVAGTITPAGALIKSIFKPLAGSVTPTGNLVRQVGKLLAGSVTPAGALTKQWQHALSGSTTPAGTIIRQTQKLLGGTITPTASASFLHKAVLTLSGTVTPAGALIKQTAKSFAGTITPAGALAATKVILVAVSGSVTPAGNLVKSTLKPLSGAVTPAGALIRAITKAIFTASTTPAGALSKQTAKAVGTFAGTTTPVGTETRQTQKPLAGSSTPIGNLFRQTGKPLSGSTTPVGTETRQTQKHPTGTVTPTGALATLRAVLISLAGSVTPAGNMIRQTGKALSGAVTPAGAIIRQIAHRMTGTVTPTGTGAYSRAVLRAFAGAVTPVGVIVSRQVATHYTGALSSIGVITRTWKTRFGGVLAPASDLVIVGVARFVFGFAKGYVSLLASAVGTVTRIGAVGAAAPKNSTNGHVEPLEAEGSASLSADAVGSVSGGDGD
jgi:hypothetical protein